MSINLHDKKSLMDNILPVVEINQTNNGITVSSERIAIPRTIQFDILGKCRECKATECETEWCVSKEGVTIWCTRFKISPRFVPFDVIYDLPGYTFFKVCFCVFFFASQVFTQQIRNKGRVFNVDHGFRSNACTQTPTPVYHLPPPPPPPQLPKRKQESHQDAEQSVAHQFYDSVSAATTGLDIARHQTRQGDGKEFFGAVSAATMGMDIEQKNEKPKLRKQQRADASDFFSPISAATMGMTSEHLNPKPKPRQQPVDASNFFSSISAATMGMEVGQDKPPKPSKKVQLNSDAAEFAVSLSAATKGLDFAQATVKKPKEPNQADATELFSAISAATMGMSSEQQQQQQTRTKKEKEQTDQEILDEFLESVSAATTNMDVPEKRKPKKKVKKEMEDEEMTAIASITRK
ncbi:hypothetical protein niasHT_002175 [Heterodera trifolii]|uniref:Uncharacterized protein n=1 Tax=Heterodera trifolii TaxID=157864 RepID=A0ABD2MF79_9BILA